MILLAGVGPSAIATGAVDQIDERCPETIGESGPDPVSRCSAEDKVISDRCMHIAMEGAQLDAAVDCGGFPPGESDPCVRVEEGPPPSVAVNTDLGANGTDAANVTDNSSVQAGSGGAGGDVLLDLADPHVILITDTAQVATGSGGAGGDVNVTRENRTTDTINGTAGPGGDGGKLGILAEANINGNLSVGDGGDGGSAYVEHVDGPSVSHGGDGGRPGLLGLPTAYDAESLHEAGQLEGANSGDGGGASSTSLCALETNGSPYCDGSGDTDTSTDNEDGRDGADASGPGNAGGDGAAGADAYAEGGDGGPRCVLVDPPDPYECVAITGGNGGNAIAVAGEGGLGGNGGDGVHNSTEKAIHGGDGGAGGTGGTAEAYAGSAGCATVGDRCGQPGHAKARSDGGDGGIPGGSGWTENLSQTIEDKCSSNSHDLCWEPTRPKMPVDTSASLRRGKSRDYDCRER